jgi:glycosyltransferase involved in cell wall biosynthesis
MQPPATARTDSEVTHSVARVLLLGPARTAVSGVSTHLNQLFESTLATSFELVQFQVGSEGRGEGRLRSLIRLGTSPFAFALCLLRARPRIVHINTSLEPKSFWRDLVYLALAKALRRKVVYQVHGGSMPAEFFARSRALRWLLRASLSWPETIVLLAHSEMLAYRSFAPRARLIRIANAIAAGEPPDLSPERYTASRPLEIVYVGRLAADKGIFEAVEALRILRDRDVTVRLSIAGSGPAESELRHRIAANELGDRVRLVGAVFSRAKEQLWHAAQVLAFPTYHREGLPYALLEAMAHGAVPVISPVGAIPDVLQHEAQGLFVAARDPQALANALERLANDRPLLHRLARAGRTRIVEHYSVARMAREFEALYARLTY